MSDEIVIASGFNNLFTAGDGNNIVRDSIGNLYVAMYAKLISTSKFKVYVYQSTDKGKTWVDLQLPGVESDAYDQDRICLVIDNNDAVHAFWDGTDSANSPNLGVKHATYSAGSWSAWEAIFSDPHDQISPSVQMDSLGNIHLAYYGYSASDVSYRQVFYTNNIGGSWKVPELVSNLDGYVQASPVLDIDSNDKVHIIWSGQDAGSNFHNQIKYSNNISGTWSAFQNIVVNTGVNQGGVTFKFDASNKIHLFWHEALSPDPNHLYYSNNTSGSWAAKTSVALNSSYAQVNPYFSFDDAGFMHVLYSENDTGNYEIKYTNNLIGSWSAPIALSSGLVHNYGKIFYSVTDQEGYLAYGGGAVDASNGNTVSFRTLGSPFTASFLVQDGTDIKSISGGSWSVVGTAPATQAMFDANGMTDFSVLSDANIRTLTSDTPKILYYTQATAPTSTVTAVPNDKLIFPTGDIDLTSAQGINTVTLTASQSGAGAVRLIVSVDSGVTWKTWSGAWTDIDSSDLAAVKAGGMDAATVNARVRADWDALMGTSKLIRFAYYLGMDASTDTASTDELSMNLEMLGTWQSTLPGTDYTYEYPDNTTLRVKFLANGDFKVNY